MSEQVHKSSEQVGNKEKEAIEKLSGKKNETTWHDTIRQIKREEIKDVVVTRQQYITLTLNYIEKLQKENNKQKEDNRLLIKSHKIATENLNKIIEKLQKENQELKEDNSHQWEERCRLTFELERLQKENEELKEKNKRI